MSDLIGLLTQLDVSTKQYTFSMMAMSLDLSAKMPHQLSSLAFPPAMRAFHLSWLHSLFVSLLGLMAHR